MADTLNDGVMSKLDPYEGSANDKQMQALRSLISAGVGGSTLNDLWLQYCTQEGFTQGTTQERIKAFMLSRLGAFPSSNYNDIQRAFWNSGGAFDPTAQIFDFSDRALRDLPVRMQALGFTYERNSPKTVLQYVQYVQNLYLWSEQFDNAVWFKDGLTVQANAALAPDSRTTADKLTPSFATQIHAVSQAVTLDNSKTYAASMYIANAGLNYAVFIVNTGAGEIQATVDLTTGAVTNVVGAIALSIEVAAVGTLRRCIASFTTDATGTPTVKVAAVQTAGVNSFSGDGVNGIYVWGAQVQEGGVSAYAITTSMALYWHRI